MLLIMSWDWECAQRQSQAARRENSATEPKRNPASAWMTGWARDSKRENKMTDEQHEQWLKDVELLGDNAYKMWEYCLMEDEKKTVNTGDLL